MSDAEHVDVERVFIEDEMKQSYINYAMSVIRGRAIPDVRDGLKPVQRRILYGMDQLGLQSNKPQKKCARIVGEVMGKYHPHGDQAIYDALAHMAQDFSYRYMLVDGQGNFGCFTGDTRIKLLDGTEKSFEALAKLPADKIFYVYSVDKSGKIVVAEGRNARVTRRNAALMELTLDNGETIRCTPDHRFLLRKGIYKEAKDLTTGDSLMPGYFDAAPVKEGLNDYLRIKQPRTGEWQFVHHLADAFNERKGCEPLNKGPYVRHHKDFNRWNNAPDNIERMNFLAHLHLHADRLATLWKDDAFRDKQRRGVQHYYRTHPEARTVRRQRFIQQNQSKKFRAENGPKVSKALRAYYQTHSEKCGEISRRMKALWTDPHYRQKMSEALAGIEKRPLTPQQKERVAAIISKKSRSMWADDAMRQRIVQAITKALASEEVRKRISARVKSNWQDPDYRAKFPQDHFSRMAQTLWKQPHIRGLHRLKLQAQRQDEAFCQRQRAGVRHSNRQRMAKNPEMMRDLAQQAALSLGEKWTDPSYKRRVMRSKILRYVNRLQTSVGELTPALYEAHRHENWVPRLETTKRYFTNFEEMVQEAQTYNHRIVAKRLLTERADVYDITVDTHHNFLLASGVFVHNSIDGDSPAAMRYTEARLSPISGELLEEIGEDTVDLVPNFDDSLDEPEVLPAKIPTLMLNGSWGISVGMTTQIPPHNLGELVDAILYLIEHDEATIEDLMAFVHGPDFPTGGIILGTKGIEDAYHTGRGKLRLRGRANIEDGRIIISEIPFQVRKSTLVESIADKVKNGVINEISDLRDESDRNGIRVVVEVKRGGTPQVVLNKLYKYTPLESTFGSNFLVISDNMPRRLSLRQMLQSFLDFRREVVRRRTEYRLAQAAARAHLLEGLLRALDNRQAIIDLIANEREVQTALQKLQQTYEFSEAQATAILQIRLRQFTGMETEKLRKEQEEKQRLITEYRGILDSSTVLDNVIKAELAEIRERYGDERRTEINPHGQAIGEIDLEALIPANDVIVGITSQGYVNAPREDVFRKQHRGGKGVIAIRLREKDTLKHIFKANTHDHLLVFTDAHKAYKIRGFQLPSLRRDAKGENLRSLIEMGDKHEVCAMLRLPLDKVDELFSTMITRSGIVNRNRLKDYVNAHTSGIQAVNAVTNDVTVQVRLTTCQGDLLLVSQKGQTIRFKEALVRCTARPSKGVRGMRLDPGDGLVSFVTIEPDDPEDKLLLVTQNGFGKRTKLRYFPQQGRGGKGVLGIKITKKTGEVVSVVKVKDGDELMVTTRKGKIIRFSVDNVRIVGRYAKGVKVIDVDRGDAVASVARWEADVETTPSDTTPPAS